MADLQNHRRGLTSLDLRRLWRAGYRARVIRRVLRYWAELIDGEEDLQWLEQPLRACGLSSHSYLVQARQVRKNHTDIGAWERLIGSVLHCGDRWWARDLLAETPHTSRVLDALRIEVALALQTENAAAAVARWLKVYADTAARVAAIPWSLRLGDLRQAERLAAGGTMSTEQATWLARFALWRGDGGTARRFAVVLRDGDDRDLLFAVADILDGDMTSAETRLREFLCVAPARANRGEALCWLAMLLRRRGCYEEAVATAQSAAVATNAFSLAARLERELSSQMLSLRELDREHFASTPELPKVEWLEHGELLCSEFGLDPAASITVLDSLLERFAGNRTHYVTTLEDGELQVHLLPIDPRHFGAVIQEVLRTRGPRAARELYLRESGAVGDHPLYRIYSGELELWAGEYAAAEGIFREILQRDTRVKWAWIGLGASLMLRGRLADAQTTWSEGCRVSGCPGPTLYAYRGECYRRQGDSTAARADLEHALRERPARLSAAINLALLNNSERDLSEAIDRCTAVAPFLMQSLRGNEAERLEKVLLAMRGNRSSDPKLITYYLWGQQWHLVTTENSPSVSPGTAVSRH